MSEFVVALSIGLGMIFSLLLTEIIGLTAGGIIVPGWVALHLHNPLSVMITFLIAFIVFSMVEIASRYMFIYGKRRLVISLLLGFIIGLIFNTYIDTIISNEFSVEIYSIGFIIPGMIANWMSRQGVLRTITIIFITAPIVQLIIMVLTRGQILNV
tara:strand:+ start:567 stop:1034 length:468 start_codon:yes stop_codon:yes gene_type:complete